ncbi:MAG: hypothetical protein QHJ34_09555 [bacterium]|nr:hypothetical protein [candidate division KSB1 bacterium]MDH7560462.1 hypothetical protein [bacterium]
MEPVKDQRGGGDRLPGDTKQASTPPMANKRPHSANARVSGYDNELFPWLCGTDGGALGGGCRNGHIPDAGRG